MKLTYRKHLLLLLFSTKQGESVVKADEQRKCIVARKLESNYASLPSIVCDDFFNRYANCVFPNSSSKINRQQVAKTNGDETKPCKQVKVCCQISEVDESRPGNKLIRRKLTKLKEEEEEEEDDEEGEDEDEDRVDAQEENLEDEEDGNEGEINCDRKSKSSNSMSGYNRDSISGRRRTDCSNKGENEDFGMFLRSQISASNKSGKSRRQVNVVYQKNSPLLSKTAINRSQRHLSNNSATNNGKKSNKLRCFELFCVHQASLLVHRDQVLIEAKRLAERLASLMSNEERQEAAMAGEFGQEIVPNESEKVGRYKGGTALAHSATRRNRENF